MTDLFEPLTLRGVTFKNHPFQGVEPSPAFSLRLHA
jgi:hypothetical protein